MSPIHYPASGHSHPYPTGEDVIDPSIPPCRVWIPERPILVLGYSQVPEREINVRAAEEADIPVYKRKGGGGAVLLTPGMVCVALRFKRKPGFGIAEYFAVANGLIRTAFSSELGIELTQRGVSDLTLGQKKVAGSSLNLPREYALFLASILVNTPMPDFDRFLLHPSREPDYRRGRLHADFMMNLNSLPGMKTLTPERVMGILDAGFGSAQPAEHNFGI